MTKKCSYCLKEKDLDCFHKHPTASLGRKNVCKPCHAQYSKQVYRAKMDALGKAPRIPMGGTVKECFHKKGDTRADGMVFWAKRKNVNGFQEWWITKEHFSETILRNKERAKWRYHNDPTYRAKQRARNLSERSKSNKRKWNHANRDYMDNFQSARRAKLSGNLASLTEDEKKRTRDWYKFRDVLNKVHGKAMFHVDHKQPIARGGTHHPDNLQVTTAHYNVTKATKSY